MNGVYAARLREWRARKNEESMRGRCSALARRCVRAPYRIVNCGPAQCCVWPVLAPAEAFVRAGAVLRGKASLLRRFAFGS